MIVNGVETFCQEVASSLEEDPTRREGRQREGGQQVGEEDEETRLEVPCENSSLCQVCHGLSTRQGLQTTGLRTAGHSRQQRYCGGG